MSLKPNPESTPESWEGNKAVYGISENMALSYTGSQTRSCHRPGMESPLHERWRQ